MFKRIISALALVCTSVLMAGVPAQAQGCRPGTSQSCPIHLRFTRGSYGVMVDGVLTRTPDARYYSIAARAGQHMIITFTGLGAMRGGIVYPGGGGDGPFDGQGTVITLPSNGTYIIYLGQNTMAGEPWRGGFTLSVLVR
jgi:hypothetical protein